MFAAEKDPGPHPFTLPGLKMVGCYKSDIQKLGNVILSESLAMMHRLLEDFMSTYHPSLDTLLCLQEPKLNCTLNSILSCRQEPGLKKKKKKNIFKAFLVGKMQYFPTCNAGENVKYD